MAVAEFPRAFLKAEYESMSKTINTRTGDTITNNKNFVLRIAHGKSFYFDPQTNRIDSLENDPQGKIMLQQADDAAMEKAIADMNAGLGGTWFKHSEKMGINRGSRYKNMKDFDTRTITVWDSQMGDRYRYPVEMDDLNGSFRTLLKWCWIMSVNLRLLIIMGANGMRGSHRKSRCRTDRGSCAVSPDL